MKSIDSPVFKRALAVCEIFEGSLQVIIYDDKAKKYVSSNVYTSDSQFVIDELKEIVGSGCVVLK